MEMSNYQRRLACPAVVSLNEAQMEAAAAALPPRQLRSGRIRLMPTIPPSPVVLSSPEPKGNVEEVALDPMPDSLARDQQLADSPLFFGDDESDGETDIQLPGSPSASLSPAPLLSPVRSPSPAPPAQLVPPAAAPAPAPAPTTPERVMPPPPTPQAASVRRLLQVEFDRSQLANQPRVPWLWSPTGRKTDQPYEPTAEGKWWYEWAHEYQGSPNVRSNVGRIMETELGVQLFGKDRCTGCQHANRECWIYSEKGRQQVKNPGSACTRCRVDPATPGCSLSNRRPARKRSPGPPPPPRFILPKGGGPDPDAGGCAV
ncbi:hypothetical protein PISL3812_09990 [Talaromyces islandicus]|uniref:Uncharacterized protein n=1 Tax=Talaromyces islandicus TaxID=28573 RepID=A0A0U1MC58_TALIS|nr:hypothetical protein PISL3812_09990 [Talaromyces islandicus]